MVSIWDLARVEVSMEPIASLAQYYDQPLRCFIFGDFQLSPMVEEFDEGWEWNYSWRRPLFDNEVATADEFLRETANLLIHPNKADLWVGKADPSGSYSTKSAYKLLRGDSRGEHQDGAFVELWKIKISAKAAVFAWRLIRDRLPTKSNLRRRQVEVNDMRCPFCNNDDEDAAHLFFHCSQVLPSWCLG